LMLRLCEQAAQKNFPIYLYGATQQTVEKLSRVLTERIPGLIVAGAVAPPFTARSDDDPELLAEIDAINKSGARLVFVALGAPKQEFFMARNAARINPVQIGVGAAFDFHSGRVAQAPPWLQDAGLEWLFRFCCEPRRLWRRYLFYNPYFIARLTLQRFGLDRPSREMLRASKTPGNHAH
jgi:N-acetylglucosaminyldiphosphoundecaprenol N-acetyl-beta-D-mannosaminyltransferase